MYLVSRLLRKQGLWLIAVAPSTNASQPVLEQIAGFRIPGNCFTKLEVGT